MRTSPQNSAAESARIMADLLAAEDAFERARTWLHEQLKAGGLDPHVEPRRIVVREDGEFSCWCGNARLSGNRAIVVYWRADRAVVDLQAYGSPKRFSTADGATVVEAVKALLAQPKHGGVPSAFIARPETPAHKLGEDWSTFPCANPRKDWGSCYFCGEPVQQTQPRLLAVHAPDGRVAHYDCAPGLGVEVVAPGMEEPAAGNAPPQPYASEPVGPSRTDTRGSP